MLGAYLEMPPRRAFGAALTSPSPSLTRRIASLGSGPAAGARWGQRRTGHIVWRTTDGPNRGTRFPALLAILVLLLHALAPVQAGASWRSPAGRLAADLAVHCSPGEAAGPDVPQQRDEDRDHCSFCLPQQAAPAALPPSGAVLPFPPAPADAALPAATIAVERPGHSPHSPRAPPSNA